MKKYILSAFIVFSLISCEDLLEEEVYSSLGPSNFYSTAEDAETLLNSVYVVNANIAQLLCVGETPTEIFFERGGGAYRKFQPMEEFSWNSTHPYLKQMWAKWYNGIFKANTVIDNVPSINMNEERREQIVAEARFLRAHYYAFAYSMWGPVPLVTSGITKPQDKPSRPTDEEFVEFVENEFIACSKILPWEQDQFSRATKGAALGFLTKFYLNNHKWDMAAETAKTIIESGVYELFKGESRADLFEIENETSNEFIFVYPISSQKLGNFYHRFAVPDNYVWKYTPLINYPATYKIRTAFLNTFDPKDQRLDAFIFKYLSTSGDTVTLGTDDVRSFKYREDPNAVGSSSNDIPFLRYADILLSRAEALNELNGPNQESIDLINEVREVAGVNDLILSNYSTKESLRDAILAERGWEFHTEGLRREDLIRHGKFISSAIERGWPAKDYMVLYPIPQVEIDANPNIQQNEGY